MGCQNWEKYIGEVVKREILFVSTGLFHVVEDTIWLHGLTWATSLDDTGEWCTTDG